MEVHSTNADPSARVCTARGVATGIVAGAVMVVCGCLPQESSDSAEIERDETVVVDSLGVSIVTSSRAVWGDSARWTIGDPSLVLGDETEFHIVEDIFRLSEGSWLVADGGAGVIYHFDRTGTVVRSFGASGNGPGEFRLIQGLGSAGPDSIWIHDFVLRRLTVVGLGDWSDPRVASLRPPLGSLIALGTAPDGAVVMREAWSNTGVRGASEPGLRRDSIAFVRYDLNGTLRDTILVTPGREVALLEEGGRIVMAAPLFPRSVTASYGGHRLVVGDPVTYEIRVFSASGSLQRIIRRDGIDLRLTPEHFRDQLEARVATEPESDQPAIREMLSKLPRPATRPAFGRLLVGEDGTLWVENTASDVFNDAASWSVFSEAGRWLGDVSMPPRFTPLRLFADGVAGVSRDALDVQTVQVRPIVRR